jgi:hypothetical protein
MNTVSCLVAITKLCVLADSSACVIRQVHKTYSDMQLISKIFSLQLDKVVPVHTKQKYAEAEVQLPTFLTHH